MIDFAVQWLQTHTAVLEHKGVRIVEQARTPDVADDPAFRVDFESANCIARLTVWEKGWCNIEALSIATDDLHFWEEREVVDDADIDLAFCDLLDKL